MFHPNSTKCEDFDLPKPVPAVSQESAVAQLIQQWPPNNFKMRFDLQVINSVRGGWRSAVKYSKPVAEISNINKARFASNSAVKAFMFDLNPVAKPSSNQLYLILWWQWKNKNT